MLEKCALRFRSALLLIGATVCVTLATAGAATAAPQSFTTLQSGFSQSIFGIDPNFMGGVAIAPDGDPWIDHCAFSGSGMVRFDAASTTSSNGTTYHTSTSTVSNAGCG